MISLKPLLENLAQIIFWAVFAVGCMGLIMFFEGL